MQHFILPIVFFFSTFVTLKISKKFREKPAIQAKIRVVK